ncbi:hypothetical protein BJV74DRAFT_881487 [Russula compacta]|nr:hypothetical protein BJV74DRAFT_881487 [Russula compacta]
MSMSVLPTPSSSRSWWSRSSVLPRRSSTKHQPSSQGTKLSGSKKLNIIATAIGLKPKKTATPVQEPVSPVLPLHTGDIESPPRSTKSVVKPVSVAVGWTEPSALPPEDFLDAYPQSLFSTDLDPFAAATKYPDGLPSVSEPLRFSTFSEVSTLEAHVRKDARYAHNRMSFASSSTLSHQRSDITSDFSPISSPLLSPELSGRRLTRLTVESERVLVREHFSSSPASPQSLRGGWDDQSCIAASPSSVTLTDVHGKSTTTARPRARSRGHLDTGRSGTDPLVSHQKVSPVSPNCTTSTRVVIRKPSSSRLQSLQPPTAPPVSELPPAPQDVQPPDFSLLPAFVERTSHSATSSSSGLSFASSASSKFDALEVEKRWRDIRRHKGAKKSGESRSTSPSTDATFGVHDSTSKPSDRRREFSPTRSLKKAISIQNIPKRALGNNSFPTLPAVEDIKSVKKQRSFHHTRIPIPSLPASLKQTGSLKPTSGRDPPPVAEECRTGVQSSQKSPLSSPVLSPTNVRKRLFSGSSLRRPMSSQNPELDDDAPSIFNLHPATLLLPRPHTAIPVNRSSALNKANLSSFWDDEIPNNLSAGNEPRGVGPQHILSAADILKFENMVRDGERLSGLVPLRKNSVTSLASSKHSVRTAHEPATSVRSFSPSSVMRQFDPLGVASSRSVSPGRQRTRGSSPQGKVGDVMNGRPQTAVTPLMLAVGSPSSESLNGLPPPRQCSRPSTSSGTGPLTTCDAPLLAAGDRSSVIALIPLSPPPVRRSATRRAFESPTAAPMPRPEMPRRPSFLDMRDDVDQELPPPEDSFLDMGKASLDTVRSDMEEDLVLS